jgi:HD-GYP domain-containing protein (c-di-GMP phosphodiesterase class II)
MVQNILGNLDDAPFLQTAAEIAESHHERWDGSGYPRGLAGEDIPLPARMMSVADVFDALVSERCYKKAMPPDEAFHILEEERGRQFDPAIIDMLPELRPAFLEVLGKTEEESP